MTSPPKYAVTLHQGRILITPTSGEPATEAEVQWLRRVIATDLRSLNFVNKHQSIDLRYEDADKPIEGHRFEIDPMVIKLVQEQEKRRFRTADVARILGVHGSTMSAHRTGKSRPSLEQLRSWAFLMDHEPMLIPGPLRLMVRLLITAWDSIGRPSKVELEDLTGEKFYVHEDQAPDLPQAGDAGGSGGGSDDDL